MINSKPNWEKYKLGEITNRITKGTTPTTLGSKFVDKGINFIKSEAIGYDGRIDRSTFVFIDEETNEKLKRSQLQKDDILFSMAGIFLGKNAIVTEDLLPANTNQALGIIRLNQSVAFPKFINYYLRQKEIIHYVNNISGQSAQPNINMQEIGGITINLPPLPTQHRIAEILGALDDKIELNLQMNKTLEEMAMVLYKHWFVDFGPFKDGEFVDSELGPIPKGWEVKKLSEIVEINRKSINPFDYPDRSFLHYSIPAFDEIGYPKIEFGNEIASNKTLIEKNTILISKLNPRIKRIWTVYKNLHMISFSSTELINYMPIDFKDWAYLNCYFRNYKFYDEFLNYTTGTTVSHQRVRPQETMKFHLTYPKESIRHGFNKIAKSYFDQIESNIKENQHLKQTRDYLLPKLISGEVSV
jgi:type I restriction enzyme S subunit